MEENSPKLQDSPAPTRSRRQLVKPVVDNKRAMTPDKLSPKKTKAAMTVVRRPPSKFSSSSSNDSPLSDKVAKVKTVAASKRVNTLSKKVAVIQLTDSDLSSPELFKVAAQKSSKTRKIESSPDSDDVFEPKSSTRSRRK